MSSSQETSIYGLSDLAVRQAVMRLCGSDRLTALTMSALLKRLLARPQDWMREARRINRVGLTARHVATQLARLLEQPGNLALVQQSDNSFLLFWRKEQHWLIIGAEGEILGKADDLAGETFVEALIMRAPLGGQGGESMNALLALWPSLRAAWAEIGIASLFVNAGQLLLPLFSMLVYDKVVSNGVFETLWALVIGMLIYLLTDLGMRLVRALATERIGTDLTLHSDENLWHRLLAQVDFPAAQAVGQVGWRHVWLSGRRG